MVSITVQEVPDGEVSPYLVEDMELGDQLEIRGPIGGWFVWSPSPEAPVEQPILLVGGGSGVVPLMAMVRERARLRQPGAVPAGLLGARPRPGDVRRRARPPRSSEKGCSSTCSTRARRPSDRSGRPGRITAADLATAPTDLAHRRDTSCLRLWPDRVRGAHHRPAPRPRPHQQDHPRRTFRTVREPDMTQIRTTTASTATPPPDPSPRSSASTSPRSSSPVRAAAPLHRSPSRRRSSTAPAPCFAAPAATTCSRGSSRPAPSSGWR